MGIGSSKLHIDCIVSDAKVWGINGGEKKIFSISYELISNPSMIFADEPTNGMH